MPRARAFVARNASMLAVVAPFACAWLVLLLWVPVQPPASPDPVTGPASAPTVSKVVPGGHHVRLLDSHALRVWSDTLHKNEWNTDMFNALERAFDVVGADAVFVDCGAWIGLHSVWAAHRGHVVIAYEPDPTAFAELTTNALLNPSIVPKLLLREACVSPYREEAVFTSPGGVADAYRHDPYVDGDAGPRVPGWPTVGPNRRPRPFRAYCDTLPALLSKEDAAQGYPLVIKLDVEGSELAILEGMPSFLRHFSPKLVLLMSMHGSAQRLRAAQANSVMEALHAFKYITPVEAWMDGKSLRSSLVTLADHLCEWCTLVLHNE